MFLRSFSVYVFGFTLLLCYFSPSDAGGALRSRCLLTIVFRGDTYVRLEGTAKVLGMLVSDHFTYFRDRL